VVDYPNSRKAKKYFLCLFAGGGDSSSSSAGAASRTKLEIPEGLDGQGDEDGERELVQFEKRREKFKTRDKGKKRKNVKDSKDWILAKKELYRKRGKEAVPRDSKYTGRQRKAVF